MELPQIPASKFSPEQTLLAIAAVSLIVGVLVGRAFSKPSVTVQLINPAEPFSKLGNSNKVREPEKKEEETAQEKKDEVV
jgi:hypothetical protein